MALPTIQLKADEITHDIYLLTWNLHHWAWSNLEEMVELTTQGQLAKDQWSCGNTIRIKIGDRVRGMRCTGRLAKIFSGPSGEIPCFSACPG